MNSQTIAIIPARGGSKRIPRKNIKEFGGKPMIAHSILTAKESGVFDKIIVSTDDEEIAVVSRSLGADVPFVRPIELSNDYANTTDVIAHALEWLQNSGVFPKAICCIYATAPFLQIVDLKKAEQVFFTEKWEYVFTATSFGFPIFRSIKKNSNGCVEMFYPEYFNTRSQDLPEAYHDAGQFYFGKPSAWLEKKRIFEPWSTLIELPRWRVQDIDTIEDWERAEILFKIVNQI